MWGAYHERERLCPEGVRVREIAHVHYACESYAGWHRGVPMAYGPWTPNRPNKYTHYLRAISIKIEIISTLRGGTSQNSTDLDSGRRPMLKSVEFGEVPPFVLRILKV